MNAVEAIKNNIQMADQVCGAYLGDLTDQELMRRPHPKCNHVNWQVGHLIASDNQMANGCLPGSLPPLPDGFADKYSKEACTNDDAAAFCSKAELMGILETQRAAAMSALENLNEADLEKPSPEAMQQFAPNVGAVFNMLGTHWMMHAGQWVVLRRELGREIIM